MHRYEVGQLYDPNRTSWPETIELRVSANNLALITFMERPSPQEVEVYRRGEAQFALYTEDGAIPVMIFCFRLGALPWCDAAFWYWRELEMTRGVPALDPFGRARAELSVFLVDASTGILRAIRGFSLSATLTTGMYSQIARQAAVKVPDHVYGRYILTLFKRCSTDQIVKLAQWR